MTFYPDSLWRSFPTYDMLPGYDGSVIPDVIGDLLYNIDIFARGSKIILLSGEFF
jgi:hypothetical protein